MDASTKTSGNSRFSFMLKIEREGSSENRMGSVSRLQILFAVAGLVLALLGIVTTLVIGLGWLP